MARLSHIGDYLIRSIITVDASIEDGSSDRQRLVDEYHLWIMPLRLGEGKRAFADVDASLVNLELFATHTFKNGALIVSYLGVRLKCDVQLLRPSDSGEIGLPLAQVETVIINGKKRRPSKEIML